LKRISRIIFFYFLLWSLSLGQTTEIVFLQMNDVYEITPLEGGKYGGLARVATLRKELIAKNPNTFTILSGDFISPSALGTADYNGKRINGAQMIDVLNHLGLNYVTFGNHEFDVKPEVLQERINESKFEWFSSNIRQPSVEGPVPFVKFPSNRKVLPFPDYEIIRRSLSSGKDIRIGIISLTLNRVSWAFYKDEYESALSVYNKIKDSVDFVIAMTHLSIQEDKELAARLPQLKLIMGGHEHNNMYEKVGDVIITKADANARTVYIHSITFDEKDNSVKMSSELKTIDESILEDPEVKQIADMWVQRAYEGFKSKGLNPDEEVKILHDTLDGLENDIRFKPTNLGKLIAEAMVSVSEKSRAAAFNSGSVRIDDRLSGRITQYDIIRTLPFGGKIIEVEMKGSLLKKILDTGMKNKGIGGYLQIANLTQETINDIPINDNETYWISLTDFLLSGQEQNMEFLTRENPGIINILESDKTNPSDLRNDIRLAVINYLKKH
jgi:2',3'-cyclic-nucleotide 2'-phosphodiesterase (5'-nucleotidase family)